MTPQPDKGKIIVRSGLSYAHDITIDPFIGEDEAKALYEKWDKAWGEPIELHGPEYIITCEMVLGVPLDQLTNVYGATMAANLVTAARRNTAM